MSQTGSFVRIYQASIRLGVTTQTIRNWINKGTLPRPMKVGRATGWLIEDWERILAQKKPQSREWLAEDWERVQAQEKQKAKNSQSHG